MNSINLNVQFLYLSIGWWKSFAIVLVICLLVAIDWQIPSNDKTSRFVNLKCVILMILM